MNYQSSAHECVLKRNLILGIAKIQAAFEIWSLDKII